MSAGRFQSLDVLRAVAVCLVVYCHLVGIWLHQHDVHSITATIVEGGVGDPLAVALNVGNLGVVLFFLVSGFIVTHTGFAERPRQYAVKRLLRIYPMLVVAVVVSAALFTVGLHPLSTGEATSVDPASLLTNMSLANYLMTPRVVLVDVGWTLVIEMLFYGVLFVALPALRRVVWPVVIGELAVVAAVLATTHLGGPFYELLAVNVGYLPALLLGQIVWAVHGGRIRLWVGVALGVVAAAEYVWAGLPGMGRQPTVYHYNLTLAIGVTVFLAVLRVESRLRPNALIGYLADRSYSLYLLHGLIAVALMNVVYPVTGYPVAVAAGVVATVVAAHASHRWVERPGMRLARRIAHTPTGTYAEVPPQ